VRWDVSGPFNLSDLEVLDPEIQPALPEFNDERPGL
jgi:hypothetical protein